MQDAILLIWHLYPSGHNYFTPRAQLLDYIPLRHTPLGVYDYLIESPNFGGGGGGGGIFDIPGAEFNISDFIMMS